MNHIQLLLTYFPEEFAAVVCRHSLIYVGIMEKEEEGMYQIGWAMYFFEDVEHKVPDSQQPLYSQKDLSLSPDDLNAVLDAFQGIPSLYGDDEISCNYKLILSH